MIESRYAIIETVTAELWSSKQYRRCEVRVQVKFDELS
jgi:hypothetical protein